MDDVEITERIILSPDIETLYRECRSVADHLGFAYFLFGTRIPTPLDKPCQLVLSGYPASWRARYDEQRYMIIDPALRHVLTSVLPLDWASVDRNSEPLQLMFGEAAEAGLKNGITLPVQGVHGERSLMSLAGPDELPRQAAYRHDLLRRAHWFAMHFHEALRKLSQTKPSTEKLRGEPRAESLSNRERDCLRRAARGESAAAIGEALNISERTAVYHLERCQQKLGVRGRQHAIARAVILGEIEPDCYPNRLINSARLLEPRSVLYSPLER